MTWFGRLLGLVVAFSGFAAAHVLVQSGDAQVPPLPTVSVTVPTVPVPPPSTPAPTVPAPSVPTPTEPVPSTPAPTVPTQPPVRLQPAPPPPPATRPAPAPRRAQPTTTTTGTAASRPPTRATVPSPSSGYSSPFKPSTAGSAGAVQGGKARPTVRSRTFEARVHRTPRRVSVRLAFVLPKADRIFLLVRGPAPSCAIAGYIPVRGREGVNRVYFAGRVHGRRLDPGVYLISLSPNRRLVPGAPTEYVRVVSQRRAQPLPDSARKPSCRAASTLAADSTGSSAVAEPSPPTPSVRPATARPAAQVSSDERDEDEDAGLVPEAGVLGAATGESAEEPFVAIAVLSLVAALLIAMVVLVARFLRGSWNP